MRARVMLVIAALLLTLGAAIATSENVPILSEQEYVAARQEHAKLLVLFTRLDSPQDCPEGVDAEQEFRQFVEETQPDCHTIIMNCDATPAPCVWEEFRSFPQVQLEEGDFGKFLYPLEVIHTNGLSRFIEKHLVNKAEIVESYEQYVDLVAAHPVVVVGFFGVDGDPKQRKAFRQAAAALYTEYKFIEAVGDESLMQKFDATFNSVRLHAGDVEAAYEGNVIYRYNLISWIDANAPWIVRECDKDAVYSDAKETYRALPVLSVYLDYEDAAQKEQAVQAMQAVAAEYRRKVSLTYANGNEEKYADLIAERGLVKGQLPVMMIHGLYPRSVFTFQGPVDEESLKAFLDGFLTKSLEENATKQAIPSDQSGPVTSVVHDSFPQVVQDPSVTAVVFFYRPAEYCRHCGSFQNTFESVAERLSDTGLVFAKLDVQANPSVPGVNFRNLPSVQMYPASERGEVKVYSGPRNVDALAAWVNKLAGIKKGSTEKPLNTADIL